ncbi:ABC transporter ATP-binding protein [Halolactibacillus alkaliphilus]|uniref:ABC transporter ATP-binding protein n=1 Tax=Halolactibacillus alkaliphilus TaxID=442899 RepID=A0A511X018_9BACI|nr:ABC transporter ATP-binding protein [Halolactibacillus alkaliphilus]GEN56297.1 ABC transporter ATP-binding protein [Halolactibacillus alkaliphilus]GGN67787.1 ABC transporter ATP-binding protein [Halolactibacillus alkaliphilus]SFO79308.1 ABC-2 type transport system ATP-binding protein [Halolactibacillus alkaliphilus]
MIIEVTDLKKNFGRVQALKGVNLTVDKGRIVGFIGPNGAGKSTTIRLLLGLLRKDGGKAKIFGLDCYQDAVEIHKRMSYVPGDVNLWPNLTGGEVIDLFIDMQGEDPKSSRKEELIKRFDFDPSRKCRTYSKGNRQKVALIAAFSVESELYILDEPTSGLDPLMEREFQALVKEQKALGKTVLLSSHILSEVEQICDDVAIIRQGEIIESGSIKDLRHLTRTQFIVEAVEDLDFSECQGVYDVVKDHDKWYFQVDHRHIAGVLSYLGNYQVTKLETKEPTLEDLFMRHYEGDAKGGV